MALVLASTVAYNDLTTSASDSTVALRSLWSPMAAEHDAAEDDVGDGGAAAGGGGVAAAGGEVDREGEDRRDRDTRLSRASNPRIAGPRLRNS